MAVKSVGIENKSQRISSSSYKENKKKMSSLFHDFSEFEAAGNSSLIKGNLKRSDTQLDIANSRRLLNENKPFTDKYANFQLKSSTTPKNALNSYESLSFNSDRSANSIYKTSDSLNSIKITPLKPENCLECYSSIVKKNIFPNKSNSFSEILESSLKKIRSPIRTSISQFEKVSVLSFEEGIYRFKNIKYDMISKKLWKKTLLQKLGKCWDKNTLEDENLEFAEQIIKFSLTNIKKSDTFHLSLIKSVRKRINNQYTKVTKNKIDSALANTKYPLIALLNFLFLEKYLHTQVLLLFNSSEFLKLNALNILFQLSDIAISKLRRSKLNAYINQCKKPLEVFCFFYAGLIVHWNINFSNNKEAKLKEKNLKKCVKKSIKGCTYMILKSAEILYEQYY